VHSWGLKEATEMIASNPNSLCREAELHYYDFLFGGGVEPIPEDVLHHIENCRNCQEQLNQLKAALSQADSVDAKQTQTDSAIAAMLRLHFGYIGRPVTCQIVKPFLPTLLDPVLQVRVPTPITVHLDNCRQCSEDFETIQEMNLNRKQLGRLSRLFAEDPLEGTVSCSEAQAGALAVALLAFHKTNTGVLKHMCACPDCREALYQYRESVRNKLLRDGEVQERFPCEDVSTADIFDYCVPYGIDPDTDQYAKFREALALHLQSCPACLTKMQQLHNTVYGIAERVDSEVVTICHIDESVKAQAPIDSDDLYGGFPIRVEVVGSEDGITVEPSASTMALKRKVSTKNLKPLIKPAVAAAAVILIAVALFFNMPTAKAVTIEQVYKAIEKIKNVYITSFEPNQTKLAQELWVSKTLNVYMIKTEKEIVLWDIGNTLKKTKNLDTDTIDTMSLADEILAGIERKMSGYLGLLPFADISDIPPGAQWSRITGKGLDASMEGIEVYDLVWIRKAYDGSGVFKRWRVFFNPKANLPHRIEWYQKLTGGEEYTLASVNVVEQLDESQMRAVLKAAAF